jgi:hypothetical protein
MYSEQNQPVFISSLMTFKIGKGYTRSLYGVSSSSFTETVGMRRNADNILMVTPTTIVTEYATWW